MVLGIVLPLAVAAPHAAAQECPSTPWPTTEFEVLDVKLPTGSLNIVGHFDTLVSHLAKALEEATLDDELAEERAAGDVAWERLVEDQLRDIARRYEAAAFGCPFQQTIELDGSTRYVVYLVDFDDEFVNQSGNLGEARSVAGLTGWAHGLSRLLGPNSMAIDRESFTATQDTLGEEHLYWVLAHELFHMIQGTYDARYGSLRWMDDASEFVIEGGADGAAMYLVSQRFPGYLETEEDAEKWLGAFPYTLPFVERGDPYRTSSFWFHLAERYGGLSVIEGILRRRLDGGSRDDRLMWLEAGLRSPRGFGEGLATLFPHFLTELASYGESRYESVRPYMWLGWTFDACRGANESGPLRPVMLRFEDQAAAVRSFWINPLSGRCVPVEWNSSGGAPTSDAPEAVALQVEVTATDRAALDELHLGLASSTIRDATCWDQQSSLPARSRSACVIEPVGKAFEVDGTWHRLWKLEPGDYAAGGEATIVLTRVAEWPWEMEWEGAKIEVRFQLLHEGASMAGAGGGGAGPSPADVDAPLEIEAKRIDGSGGHVHSTTLSEACLLGIDLYDSESPREASNWVRLRLYNEGSIDPGSYRVVPEAVIEGRSVEHGHPGEFGVQFGLNGLGYFEAESGTVHLTSIAGRMVQGEVWATGSLRGATPGGWGKTSDERRSITARFSAILWNQWPEDHTLVRDARACLEDGSATS